MHSLDVFNVLIRFLITFFLFSLLSDSSHQQHHAVMIEWFRFRNPFALLCFDYTSQREWAILIHQSQSEIEKRKNCANSQSTLNSVYAFDDNFSNFELPHSFIYSSISQPKFTKIPIQSSSIWPSHTFLASQEIQNSTKISLAGNGIE